MIDTDRIERDRDRIWKAAIAQYRASMQPMLSSAHQGQSDKQNEGFTIENRFISAVEIRCLEKLKASAGFPLQVAIEESLVCASVEHLEDGGVRVVQRQATKTDQQDIAECLKLLGFERDDNPTGRDRTRKWRFTGTDDTESAQRFVSAKKPRVAHVQLISNTDTQTKRAVWISEEKA